MSLRGYPDRVPRRQSMFSAAYATAPVTEAPCNDDINRWSLNYLILNSLPMSKFKLFIQFSYRNDKNKQKHRSWMNLCFHMKREIKEPVIDVVPPESVNFDISDEV